MDRTGRQPERRNGTSRIPWGGRSYNVIPGMETSVNGTRGAGPEETRASVGAHGFWRRGTTAQFDVCIINLDAGSYLHMMP